jgi:hypothetical protein
MAYVSWGVPWSRLLAVVSSGFVNGEVSFWHRQAGLPAVRDPLPGAREYDVCVVGGGLTGLWTAYYLKRARPELRVAVLEKEFAGFGASGRNGGWLTAELAGSAGRYARPASAGPAATSARASRRPTWPDAPSVTSCSARTPR